MKRTLALATPKKVGKKVLLKGWVNTRRDHGKIIFFDLRDRSGIVQVVTSLFTSKVKSADAFEVFASDLRPEFVIEVIGTVKKRPPEMVNPKIPTGEVEVKAEKIEVLAKANQRIPIQVAGKGKEVSLSKRLDWRWLDLRDSRKQLIFKVWTTMEQAFREYWLSDGYIQIHSPKFMSSPSESGAELFEVKYFDRKAYLAQSPQFYKQMAMTAGLEKVFEIGPVFRANPSFTSRHDTEFTSYDMEISFIESHQDVIHVLEEILVHVLTVIKDKYGEKIKEFYKREIAIPKVPFPQITFKEAKKRLAKAGVPSKKGDFSPKEERKLCEIIKKEQKHEFVFVTEYPIEARPFYHMRLETNPKLTKSFDLFWNGLEITTGAQREHRYNILVRQAKEKGLRLEPIRYYFNFFKFGCPPHGGFGFGPTRALTKILNVDNVREVTFVYRGVNRLVP